MIIESLNNIDQQIIQHYGWPKELTTMAERESEDYIKLSMDYFKSVAFSQYKNNERFRRDYKLFNGEFDFKDYVNDPDYQDISDFLSDSPMIDHEIPQHLQHFSIVNQPINTLRGEFIKRPYKIRVEASDDESLREKVDFRTNLLKEYVINNIKQKTANLAPEEQQKLTEEELSERVLNYTTVAETWGNKILEALRTDPTFHFKRNSTESFTDLLVTGREFHHFYPDNSKLGFTYKVENPSNVWYLAHRNAKTTDDCWALGTIEVLTLGEIVDRYDLPANEIEHLNKRSHPSLRNNEYSPFSPTHPALNDPLYNLNLEAYGDFVNNSIQPNIYAFNSQYNFTVVKAYWRVRKKLYKRTYKDDQGNTFTDIQNETYKLCKECGDEKLESFYTNQWYEGLGIGPDVYHVKPLEWATKSPLVGIINTTRNTQGKSILQLLKPLQILYNICINQIREALENEIGTPIVMDARLVPNSNHPDPIQHMVDVAREKGVLLIDTSLENTGGAIQFNQITKIDATQREQIVSRIELARTLKEEALELVGITRQRLGAVQATESATGTNTALSQSYAQTEPWFMFHDYILTQVYQTLLDVVQYVELQKPNSILSYLNDDLEQQLLTITKEELLRDLFVRVKSYADDRDMLETIKQLAQPAMQNGAELTEISDLLTANSQRSFKETLTKIQKRKEQQFQQQMQQQQAELQQKQQQFEQQLQYQEQVRKEESERDDRNKQLDRENKIQLEVLRGIANESSFDPNVDLTSELIEQAKLQTEKSKHEYEKSIKNKELQLKEKELNIKQKDVEQKLQIAKINDKGKYKK